LVDRKGDGQLCPLQMGFGRGRVVAWGQRSPSPFARGGGAVSSQFVDTTLAELGFEGFEAAFEVVEFGAEVSEILFHLGDAGGLSAGCGSEVGCIGG
jgi:hypothetical protein